VTLGTTLAEALATFAAYTRRVSKLLKTRVRTASGNAQGVVELESGEDLRPVMMRDVGGWKSV
jgi:hypothetical protein